MWNAKIDSRCDIKLHQIVFRLSVHLYQWYIFYEIIVQALAGWVQACAIFPSRTHVVWCCQFHASIGTVLAGWRAVPSVPNTVFGDLSTEFSSGLVRPENRVLLMLPWASKSCLVNFNPVIYFYSKWLPSPLSHKVLPFQSWMNWQKNLIKHIFALWHSVVDECAKKAFWLNSQHNRLVINVAILL